MESSDEQLCRAVATREPGAFDLLVERYQERAYRIAWSVIEPGKVYEARFTKLIPTVTGDPILYNLVRKTPDAFNFISVALDFGSNQERVQEALARLQVGESVALRLEL